MFLATAYFNLTMFPQPKPRSCFPEAHANALAQSPEGRQCRNGAATPSSPPAGQADVGGWGPLILGPF